MAESDLSRPISLKRWPSPPLALSGGRKWTSSEWERLTGSFVPIRIRLFLAAIVLLVLSGFPPTLLGGGSGRTTMGQAPFASNQETGSTAQPTISLWSKSFGSGNVTDPGLLPGKEFTVSVNITGAPQFDRYAFNLEYHYGILGVVNATLRGTVFWGNTTDSYLATWLPGKIEVSVQGTRPVSGSGVLVFASFKVLQIDLSIFSLTNAYISLQGNAVPHSDRGGCFNNRTPKPTLPDFSFNPSPLYGQTSEYMIGKIAVGIVLPESTGPRYNWTDSEVNETIEGIRQAMSWWASQEPSANLTFSYTKMIRVPTIYEPMLMPGYQDTIWIENVMNALGYPGDAYTATLSFDNHLREMNHTDWAFTIFVADSDPYDRGFAGTTDYAHALIGGPYLTMTRYSTWAWQPAPYSFVVPAHETGHIFGATDEYNHFQEYSGYLGTADADGATGIMNSNYPKVSVSTRAQLGLLDCDADGKPDLLDTRPAISLNSTVTGTSVNLNGRAIVVPYPTSRPGGRDTSIGKIVSVNYTVDGGLSFPATPRDEAFDGPVEDFSVSLSGLPPGPHVIDVNATNSVGNSGTTTTQVSIPPGTSTPAELIKWEARARYRNLILGRISSQTLQADMLAHNSPTYVYVKFNVTSTTGPPIIIITPAERLMDGEERILEASWFPAKSQASYRATATLYQSSMPIAPGSGPWTQADSRTFSFRVAL